MDLLRWAREIPIGQSSEYDPVEETAKSWSSQPKLIPPYPIFFYTVNKKKKNKIKEKPNKRKMNSYRIFQCQPARNERRSAPNRNQTLVLRHRNRAISIRKSMCQQCEDCNVHILENLPSSPTLYASRDRELKSRRDSTRCLSPLSLPLLQRVFSKP